MKSQLTKSIQERSVRVSSPFQTLRILIEARFRYDAQMAKFVYDWLTFQDEGAKTSKKACCIRSDLLVLPCEPALHAMVFWSKMKFNVIASSWLPRDLRLMLLGFIREVENQLSSGLEKHFTSTHTSNSTELDDFCEFALGCCAQDR